MNRAPLQVYSHHEINQVLDSLRRDYDMVRLVDGEECREITLGGDGSFRYGEECYHLWGATQRCDDCSSFHACMTHAAREKDEIFQQKEFHITSMPLAIRRADGELEFCVMELARVRHLTPEEEREAREKQVDDYEYLCSHDVLTRLYNEGEVFRRMRQRLMRADGKRYLLIKCNVNNFRLLNSLLGRQMGNEVLIGIADILREACVHGEIYGRVRDDQFAILAEKDAFTRGDMERCLSAVRRLVDSPVYSLHMRLGIYEITDRNMPLSQMMDRADLALSTIRNSHHQIAAYYEEGMLESRLEDQRIISEFERNVHGEQFQIYLQPQADMSGRILGAEALVRWIREDGTSMPLPRFLPVLAQSDLITAMDMRMWKMAAEVLASWKDTPCRDLYISVNVDPLDFYYTDVPATLRGLCRDAGVSIDKMRVEITETALAETVGTRDQVVDRLRKEGFIVEIDDFGKGSSSLSMLKDVNADVLKIDMGFLDGGTIGHRGGIILESVVSMAKRLRMDVIIEGVETEKQRDILREIGVDLYQGFLLSPPIPVKDFENLYLKN